MCELLNRIWSRPRGEWTRVLRKELPALAARIVEELLHGSPELAALGEDVDDELLIQAVEEALLGALGYRPPHTADRADCDADCDADGDTYDCAYDGHGRPVPVSAPVPAPALGAAPAAYEAGGGPAPASGHGQDHAPGGQDQPHERVRGHDEPRCAVVEMAALPLDRARQELFLALTAEPGPADNVVAELAAAAGWPLPTAVRAVALATPGETQQLAAVLDDGLAGMVGGQPCLLVPSLDDDVRVPLETALRGRFAAVGHPVPVRDTASSLRWAMRLLALSPGRAGLDTRAVFVDDHLSTLMLLQDEPLAHALAARWLRPLADLTPRQSERLEVTLLAWLEGGGAPEAAKALSVHPQTVRYRMRQLEKLFGPGLRDPRTRFELEMALRSRRLMAQVRRQHSRVSRRVRPVTTEFRPLGIGRMARVNGL
ncbi:PucR family transcriptional regulator [Streptomyces bambusae]|uniref:PucR family transcriptional regulator n=2 Tax=Streptomyces bambusae TaxID=1550616 RepID=A0ABS6ZEP8_9ACTN|nr:PucR family transcriptional regulator [Streptomyces bambusae]